MGLLDRILGIENTTPPHHESGTRPAAPGRPQLNQDEQALERYRYMLKTAPPETLEQAHAEAFARLTPEQRRMALAELANAAPPGEREAAQAVSSEDPRAMARLATRQEVRQPGFMERTFGGMGGGMGGSLLGSLAMGFVGSMVANSFFSAMDGMGGGHESDVAGDPNDHAGAAGSETAGNDVHDDFGDDFGGDDFGGDDF